MARKAIKQLFEDNKLLRQDVAFLRQDVRLLQRPRLELDALVTPTQRGSTLRREAPDFVPVLTGATIPEDEPDLTKPIERNTAISEDAQTITTYADNQPEEHTRVSNEDFALFIEHVPTIPRKRRRVLTSWTPLLDCSHRSSTGSVL